MRIPNSLALANFDPGFSPEINRLVLIEILEVTLAPFCMSSSFN